MVPQVNTSHKWSIFTAVSIGYSNKIKKKKKLLISHHLQDTIVNVCTEHTVTGLPMLSRKLHFIRFWVFHYLNSKSFLSYQVQTTAYWSIHVTKPPKQTSISTQSRYGYPRWYIQIIYIFLSLIHEIHTSNNIQVWEAKEKV